MFRSGENSSEVRQGRENQKVCMQLSLLILQGWKLKADLSGCKNTLAGNENIRTRSFFPSEDRDNKSC